MTWVLLHVHIRWYIHVFLLSYPKNMELFRFRFLSLGCFSHFGIFFSGWQFMVLTWNIPWKQTWQSEENSRYRVCILYLFGSSLRLLRMATGFLKNERYVNHLDYEGFVNWTLLLLQCWTKTSIALPPTSSLPVIKAEDMSMHSHQISPMCQRIKA